MSRVQCLECGTAVVVDPTGTCPEGHLVGSTGARVAQAMGGHRPHPDEPEPWVATVVLDEADARPVSRERTIRPVPVLGAEDPVEDDEASDHESMLRELHALGELHDVASDGPAPHAMTPPSAAPPHPVEPPTAASTPAVPPATSAPAPPPREQFAEGLAELSALESVFHALNHDEEAAPGEEPDLPTAITPAAAPAASPAGSYDDLADYEDLFAAGATPSGESHDPRDAARRVAPAAPPTSLHAVGPDTDATSPSAPPPTATPSIDEPTAPIPAPESVDPEPVATEPVDPEPAATEPAAASDRGLDLANFTANGAKVGSGRGGRRKFFGR